MFARCLRRAVHCRMAAEFTDATCFEHGMALAASEVHSQSSLGIGSAPAPLAALPHLAGALFPPASQETVLPLNCCLIRVVLGAIAATYQSPPDGIGGPYLHLVSPGCCSCRACMISTPMRIALAFRALAF